MRTVAHSLRFLKLSAFWEGQLLALGAVLAATMARQLMSPLVADEMPHIPFLAAVLICAMRSGLAAGVMATLARGVAANYVFVGDRGRFAIEAGDIWASLFFAPSDWRSRCSPRATGRLCAERRTSWRACRC